jgi:pyruvate/2-oxoglutarate/acetoin dehydrogenase E1 component
MNYTDAIKEAHHYQLVNDEKVFIIGLGVNYPNGADGTTKGLSSIFPDKLIDVPVSELSFTGMAVGMASQGYRPVIHHGRIEFALLALDQILTQASRWNYMFGGEYNCPVFLRICIGRQWGNGPQHTANYHSIFMQSPGLDIFIPATPKDAYRIILRSLTNTNPSVMLEHRWLYKTSENFSLDECILNKDEKIEVASIYGEGEDFTIITYGDGLIDSLKFLEFTLKNSKIRGRVICIKYLSAYKRISDNLLVELQKSNKIIAVDTAPFEGGILSSILGQFICETNINSINFTKCSPEFNPCPTSPKLVGEYYPNVKSIAKALSIFGYNFENIPEFEFDEIHNAPNYEYNFNEFVTKNIF